jgi:hypothetical protein
MARENLPPIREVPEEVIVSSHVGGLVRSFERRAA